MMHQTPPQIPENFLDLFSTDLRSLIETEKFLQKSSNSKEFYDDIKQRLEQRYGCHASSTHPLLYAEYRMVIKILYNPQMQSADYHDLQLYFDEVLQTWNNGKSVLPKLESSSAYILSWGRLSYKPLSEELQEIQHLILLKIDFFNFQRLLSALKADYYSRNFFFRRAKFSKEDVTKAWFSIQQNSFLKIPQTLVAPVSEQYFKSDIFLGSNYCP